MLSTWMRRISALGVLLICGGVVASIVQAEPRGGRAKGLKVQAAAAGRPAVTDRRGPGARWNEPPRNAREFPTISPAIARLSHRAAASRRGAHAHAAHIITCVAYASTTRGNLRYVAHGSATCDFPADLLSAMACIDGWTASNGGYWTRVGCSAWKTKAPGSQITADGYGRDCVNNKIYRAVAVVSAFHDTAGSAADYAPSHPCGHY
jgi:hypothetical protein